MNAFVDQLIDQHDAPGPKMPIKCVSATSTACIPYPIGTPLLYRVYFYIPGFTSTGINTNSYDEALSAVEGALFCGSAYATIDYVAGREFNQEIWQAVQS